LLVVIAIISMVTLATVPMILPALDTRRVRESARIVSTQLASAQSEAMARGRSVGVWIERLRTGSGTSFEPSAAMNLYLCEVPQPWAGGQTTTTAQVFVTAGVASFQILAPAVGANPPQADQSEYALTSQLIHAGDLVRFNYRGRYYRISSDPSKNT